MSSQSPFLFLPPFRCNWLQNCSRQSQPTTTSCPQLRSASVVLPICILHTSVVFREQASSTSSTTVLADSPKIVFWNFLYSRRLSNAELRLSIPRTPIGRVQAPITSVARHCRCKRLDADVRQRTHLITVDILLAFLPDFFRPLPLLRCSSTLDIVQFSSFRYSTMIDEHCKQLCGCTLFLHHPEEMSGFCRCTDSSLRQHHTPSFGQKGKLSHLPLQLS